MGEIIKKCQGHCPMCGSEDLEMVDAKIYGTELEYEFTCDDCGSEGTEWYELKYIETSTK
jgi:uncharacterized OB-fold protein